jgi:hypothetical protein
LLQESFLSHFESSYKNTASADFTSVDVQATPTGKKRKNNARSSTISPTPEEEGAEFFEQRSTDI